MTHTEDLAPVSLRERLALRVFGRSRSLGARRLAALEADERELSVFLAPYRQAALRRGWYA